VLFISDVPGDDPALIGSGLLGPAPSGDALHRQVIASIESAVDGAAEAARARGLTVRRAGVRFAGEAQRLATQFTHELALGSAQVYLWGGESTVRLPAAPGRGGRNQHLALAAARLIAGYGDLALLAAGTDGIDGPTEDAGAVVDGETCGRIAVLGFDADESLRRADSGRALAAAGALLRTGPTGTNVADLVIGLRDAPQRAVL
jgi:glycerate 2-kinase